MNDNYSKIDREKFMHSYGTTAADTFLAIIPCFSYAILTIILTNLLNITNTNLNFLIEFIFVVIPTILHVTILHESRLELFLLTLVLAITLLFLITQFKPEKNAEKPKCFSKHMACVTSCRSLVNFISVIAILAVDFRIFPRKFAKTENSGYSLMDVGTGLFVTVNGLVETGHRTNFIKTLKGSVPLIVLAFGRLVATKLLNYTVPVTEYGLHWNFFVTLLICKIFVSLLFSMVKIEFIWINGLLLMISHEILLQLGLANYVFSKKLKRTTFLTANREGIVSAVGYVCLYIFGASFIRFMNLKNDQNKIRIMTKFVLVCGGTLLTSIYCEKYFGISRKLANAAFCSWMLFITYFMLMLFYYFEQIIMAFSDKLKKCRKTLLIFEAINYNGLVFFLFANLLTGLVNILCDTLIVDSTMSLLILCFYMLFNCGLVLVLYTKEIRLKL